MRLVLASNSPRRRELLALGGWDYHLLAPQVDERVRDGEDPETYVRRLAESKARTASSEIPGPAIMYGAIMDDAIMDDAVIVAADTAVVAAMDATGGDNSRREILGKPADAAEAEEMLRRLRGRVHQVYTALAVLRWSDNALLSEVCITDVPMRNYSDEEMLAYIASGDPMDKAGAYAIQHPGYKPVESLRGCFANVMGLPVCHLVLLLAQFDVHPAGDARPRVVAHACQEAVGYRCPIYEQVLSGEMSRFS